MSVCVSDYWSLVRQVTNLNPNPNPIPNPNPNRAKLLRLVCGLVRPVTCRTSDLYRSVCLSVCLSQYLNIYLRDACVSK